MKKLMLAVVVGSVTFISNAALEPAKTGDPDVVKTNNVEYTRRGSMGTKNYSVTDVETDKMLRRGYNAFGIDEIDEATGDEERYDKIPSSIWGGVESSIDPATGKMKIKIPVKDNEGKGTLIVGGQPLYSNNGMAVTDDGWEYITSRQETDLHGFTYVGVGKDGYVSNGSFRYGTNRTDKTSVDTLELPRGGKGETIQNNHLIFADRAWFTNFIIKAGIKTEQQVKDILNSMN